MPQTGVSNHHTATRPSSSMHETDSVAARHGYVELELPPFVHVGIVVRDLDATAATFERIRHLRVTDVAHVTLEDAIYHGRQATISFRRGLISSGISQIELTQPLSDSPFADFLGKRKADGVHHLAYHVEDVDWYLERLQRTYAKVVLEARLPGGGNRVVLVDGLAHGHSIELIERSQGPTGIPAAGTVGQTAL
jgi:methylmalonyl-CoA/ethylmalonyl-CoA epimerase